jgi:putative addiction module component (TIGR02574 family)
MIEESLLSKIKSLSPAERLELIGVVWQSLDLEDVPVTETEKVVLDARIGDEAVNPGDVSAWPEAEARLREDNDRV